MFVSLPPWAVARNVGWPEQARLAARVGYKGIDWAFGPAKTAGVDATKALLAELGIVPTITNLPMQNPLAGEDAAFETQLSKLGDDAAFSQAIGCRRFQVVLGATTVNGQSKEERWKIVQSRLSAIAGVLAKHDVSLSLEFLGPLIFRRARPRPVRRRRSRARRHRRPRFRSSGRCRRRSASAKRRGRTSASRSMPGTGTTRAARSPTSAPPQGARILHIHVSDAKPMPPEEVQDNMRYLAGEGVIDLVGFFQALKAIGYQGGVAPETIGPRIPDGMPPEESAKLALEATTAILKKAGVA